MIIQITFITRRKMKIAVICVNLKKRVFDQIINVLLNIFNIEIILFFYQI